MWERFKYWFKNVYWYHYRTHTVVTAFVIVLVVSLLVSVLRNKDPDIEFIIVSTEPIVTEQAIELASGFDGIIGDINGDGKVYSLVSELVMNGEMAYASQQRIMLFMVTPENPGIIAGESVLPYLSQMQDGYVDLSALGYETHEKYPWAAKLTGSPVLEECDFIFDEFYFVMKQSGQSNNKKKQERLDKSRQAALDCLDYLLEDRS